MPNFYRTANKRYLHKRSHLTLEFPQSNGRALRAFIPILENPQIEEIKSSNLTDYSLLGRANSVYAYMGSRSREINLTFKFNLLHLMEIDAREDLGENFERGFKLFFNDKELAKAAFAVGVARDITGGGVTQEQFIGTATTERVLDTPHAQSHRSYYQSLVGIITGQPNFIDNATAFIVSDILGGVDPTSRDYKQMNRLVDLVMTWVNLIRATTLNNSTNTTLGPPIVRLTHGPLYNNIPCVVDGYSMRLLDDSGYDVQTLMPRQIEVSLMLKEYRVGNFGTFKASKLEDGDNNVGWEAIVETNNMDPYTGVVSLET